jgi:hypothetical protein
MRTASFLAAIAFTTFAGGARADEARFGSKGQLVPLGSLSASYSDVSTPGTSASVTSLSLGPTLLYFLGDDVAFGISATLGRQTVSQGNTSSTVATYAFAPTVGYNLRLTKTVSLFPQLAIGFRRQEFRTDPAGDNPTLTTITLQVLVPLLFHPAPHFFLGFGPAFSYDLAASLSNAAGDAPKTTTIGAQTVLGGYF